MRQEVGHLRWEHPLDLDIELLDCLALATREMEGRAGGCRFSSTDLLLRRPVIAPGPAEPPLRREVTDLPLRQGDARREKEEPIPSSRAVGSGEEQGGGGTPMRWKGADGGGEAGGAASPMGRGEGRGEVPPVREGRGEELLVGEGQLAVGGVASPVGREEGRCRSGDRRGAAVCQGKVSEGLDFADRAGGAVIVTGMPFATPTDPKAVRSPGQWQPSLA
uniref:ATP-dependent helicase C-terminal domain-containing protein n=1 Tax=Oryza punctata TaxID=4537 RepID=A0A0E0JWF7_ORYPU